MAVVTSPVIGHDLDEILDRDLPWDRLSGSTVLVTGASGMLPSYAVYSLLALNDRHGAGITVHGLVRNEAKARRLLADVLDRPDFHLVVHDVSQPLELPGPLDYVIHGASPARPVLHGTDPVATIKANLLGSFHLLDLSVAKRSRGFALMSSAEVYGAQPTSAELIEEQSYSGFDILAPRACYAEGKRAAETICAAYQAQFGIECRVARFGHVYGPGMALDDSRVQADFAANVVAGQDIVLTSDGSAVRTYTYVADAIAGMFYALLRGDQMAYNIADPGGLVSIRRLAELFTQVRPEKSLRLVFTNGPAARSYSPATRQALSSRRLAALGWRPLVGLPAGLDRMVTELEAATRRLPRSPVRPGIGDHPQRRPPPTADSSATATGLPSRDLQTWQRTSPAQSLPSGRSSPRSSRVLTRPRSPTSTPPASPGAPMATTDSSRSSAGSQGTPRFAPSSGCVHVPETRWTA